MLAIDLDIGDVVLEDGGDIDLLRQECQFANLYACVVTVLLLLCLGRGPIRLTQLRDGGEERGMTDLREGTLGEDTVDASVSR